MKGWCVEGCSGEQWCVEEGGIVRDGVMVCGGRCVRMVCRGMVCRGMAGIYLAFMYRGG